MKLSTRSRYGTRLMVDMAQHHELGPVQLGDIAKRQDISLKYLEQIIIPLKKARLVRSVRGPKGGHLLAKSPKEITVAEIVGLMEGSVSIMECTENPEACDRSANCPTRQVWKDAEKAMYERLGSVTLWDLVEKGNTNDKADSSNHRGNR